MKRITVSEALYARFKDLCSINNCTQGNMIETLMDSYASVEDTSISESNEVMVARISSLEIELLELRNQLISST